MKIISWNCKGAYRTKAELLQSYKPDIVVVPECEFIAEQTPKKLWIGDNHKKGLGVFSYSDYELELDNTYNPNFKYILPLHVHNRKNFNLLAIWAMNDKQEVRRRYIGQVWLALNYYNELFKKPIIIIGDFNWNIKMDAKPTYPLYGNFSDILQLLSDKGIISLYHSFHGEDFGKETKPTLFMHHNQVKQYHVDYCFASKDFKVNDFEVGKYSDWAHKSDHVPIIVTI